MSICLKNFAIGRLDTRLMGLAKTYSATINGAGQWDVGRIAVSERVFLIISQRHLIA
jgi:hypothetical protein